LLGKKTDKTRLGKRSPHASKETKCAKNAQLLEKVEKKLSSYGILGKDAAPGKRVKKKKEMPEPWEKTVQSEGKKSERRDGKDPQDK